MKNLKNPFRSFVKRIPFSRKMYSAIFDFRVLREITAVGDRNFYLDSLKRSQSQLRQDVVALYLSEGKSGGTFVEFGGADGVHFSNSFMLEQSYGWQGVIAEPCRKWHASLAATRSCEICHDCVWRESNQSLTFTEAEDGELSTITSFSSNDFHRGDRKQSTRYQVNTISLLELLKRYDMPKFIDFLSVDTEGSEFEILSAFDFSQYQFGFICCEHNHQSYRQDIYELLTSNGYKRVCTHLSRFDDWYIPEDCTLLS